MERVRTFASSRARSGKGRLVYLVHGESGGIVVLSAREYESVRGDELASQFEVCDLLSGAEALAQRIRRRT